MSSAISKRCRPSPSGTSGTTRIRLAMIRNKAIAASRCEYISYQIDGDLNIQRNFIQDHMIFAQRGCSSPVARHHHRNAHPQGTQRGDHLAHTTDAGRAQQQQRHPHPAHGIPLPDAGSTRFVKGCNMAFWRNDLIRVDRVRRIVLRLGPRRTRTGDPLTTAACASGA